MTSITIYHNPKCGTSRNTLAMVRQSGVEPHVVDYLVTPPNRTDLQALLRAMGVGYKETSDGPILLDKIGIPAIRAACPHFADWLSQLEHLPTRTKECPP